MVRNETDSDLRLWQGAQRDEIAGMTDATLARELRFARGFAPPADILEASWLEYLETESLKRIAQNVLERHDALQETTKAEPPSDKNGMPLDESAWMTWYEKVKKPAHADWSEAMDQLAIALGEPTMSRHPFNFRPRCEEIIARSAATREP